MCLGFGDLLVFGVDNGDAGNAVFSYTIDAVQLSYTQTRFERSVPTVAWTTPSGVTVDQTYSATSANAQSGVAVAQAIATVAPTGIQRLVTNLPHHSHRIVNSTSEQYWLLIDTDTAVNADIEVWFRGTRIPAASLSKPGAVNLHLATGDNIFFFTLDQNQLNSWNSNSRSATPDSNGFEIRDDTSTPLETIHDYNQFFTGTGQVYQEMHFISPDRTQTGTITFDNDGNWVFASTGTNNVTAGDFTETP